ncbi:Hypothetical protein FKW44_012844, partial [Caligus rogercresseyi]
EDLKAITIGAAPKFAAFEIKVTSRHHQPDSNGKETCSILCCQVQYICDCYQVYDKKS